MANKNAKEVTKKATATKAKAIAPKTETKAKVEAPKTEEKKSTEKKAPKANKAKVEVTIQEVVKMLEDAGIGFKPNNCEYRILKGNSAIHVHKNKIFINCTEVDFESISNNVKAEDLVLQKEGNIVDSHRPARVEFVSTDTLKSIIKAIAGNNAAVA